MGISKISFENFTAFKKLTINCSEGVNILIGENGTGKTHILKAAYSACNISKSGDPLAKKLVNVFMPYGKQLNRLVYRQKGSLMAGLEITREVKIEIEGVRRPAVVLDSIVRVYF